MYQLMIDLIFKSTWHFLCAKVYLIFTTWECISLLVSHNETVRKLIMKLNSLNKWSNVTKNCLCPQKMTQYPRYIKVKVEHYLLFMFSPPKISWVVSVIKYICLHLLPVFYVIQPSSKQIICFDFRKQNSVLPIVFYVPCQYLSIDIIGN